MTAIGSSRARLIRFLPRATVLALLPRNVNRGDSSVPRRPGEPVRLSHDPAILWRGQHYTLYNPHIECEASCAHWVVAGRSVYSRDGTVG